MVKQRLSDATGQPISQIQLRSTDNELLDEEKTLQDQGLHEDCIIHYVFKIPDSNNDEWEEVNIISNTNNNNNNNGNNNNNKNKTSK